MVPANEKSDVICGFDDAMDVTGFGKYNFSLLASCCLIILAMYLDIFGLSVVLPAVACDLSLSTAQQGLLSAVPLVGVVLSSYAWGLCADMLGRRWTLQVAMPVGLLLSMAASVAPNYASLAALKFLSVSFTSSANAAAFVLVGESAPRRHRSRFMFLMASATLLTHFFICLFALPVLRLTFNVSITWLSLEYRPWRLLLLLLCLPSAFGQCSLLFLHESPKFLLSKSRDGDAMDVLRAIYWRNTGSQKDSFPISSVFLDEPLVVNIPGTSFLYKMWNQTAPLFKPPLLKNSLILYYILLCAYMTSTGYMFWISSITNAYFAGDDATGKTFCEVASNAATSENTSTDCNHIIKPLTLYAVMTQSGVSGALIIIMSFLIDKIGKRRMTIAILAVSASCGLILLFVRVPMLSIALFYVFMYSSFVLGNINTYLVELNPTHLRGMATCLSVVVARGSGFFSVQLIAALLELQCTATISGYVLLVTSGIVTAIFLPSDKQPSRDMEVESVT